MCSSILVKSRASLCEIHLVKSIAILCENILEKHAGKHEHSYDKDALSAPFSRIISFLLLNNISNIVVHELSGG